MSIEWLDDCYAKHFLRFSLSVIESIKAFLLYVLTIAVTLIVLFEICFT